MIIVFAGAQLCKENAFFFSFHGFAVLIYVRCDRRNPPMKISKSAKLLDNYRHISNIFVWADETIKFVILA